MSPDKNNKTVYLPGLPSASITTDESTLVTLASAEALYDLSSSSTAHAPYGLQPTTVDVVTGLPQNSATTQTWSLPTLTTTPVWLHNVSKPHIQENPRFPPQRHLGFLTTSFELQSTSTELLSRIHTSTTAPTGQPVYPAGHSSSLHCN
ncbi:hypothetical protein DPMN_143180 [Dreissena polymorpha]|uniref:Uncharacterized protein n=1 Tax=Dreissena polymorpha TaxID=45954 RepID=A0A9D4GCL8_DREPO|nr:hypothetical protein DPMN_143180 [Dreissena polymorpha]